MSEKRDSLFKKFVSVFFGSITGFALGVIFVIWDMRFYFTGLSGRWDVFGWIHVLPYGFKFGGPIGAIVGAALSYIKRNSKNWRIFFLISGLITLIYFGRRVFMIWALNYWENYNR